MAMTYQAQWFDPKDCCAGGDVDGEFDPYNLTTSDHDNLLDAQIAAVKGAKDGNFYHGVAYVQAFTEWNEPDGPDWRNEVWKNKWQGWEVIRDGVEGWNE